MSEQPSNDHLLWRVQVLSEGLQSPRSSKPKPATKIVRRYDSILVRANDTDGAMLAAKSYVDGILPPEVKWQVITPLSAARLFLPIALNEI